MDGRTFLAASLVIIMDSHTVKTFMTEALRDGKSGGWKIEQRGEKGGQGGGGGGERRNKRREDKGQEYMVV
ncbi:hypothetical protein Pcinc_042821 [Petrolisthes cinctipes]|uniref:Uncharacterized protein n=1 Tax=Petrolisthes cinctipes TaxID=88211 RepID=A0AAE1EIF5_PETCI|nr:hypothetical protein Pcinc_042821 [Petrolisthes cinctipes]